MKSVIYMIISMKPLGITETRFFTGGVAFTSLLTSNQLSIHWRNTVTACIMYL